MDNPYLMALCHLFVELVAARALATYLIPGCVGRGSGWDLRIRPAPAPAASGNLGMFVGIKIDLKWVHMARCGLIQPPK